MARVPEPDDQRRAALRPSVAARPDRDRHEQHRASDRAGLGAWRTQDGHSRRLRRLFRAHPTARDIERLAARRLEIPRRPVQLRPDGRARLPQVAASFPVGFLPSVTTIDPEIENAYTQQANLQIERELTASVSLSVGYLHTRGLPLILSRNVNDRPVGVGRNTGKGFDSASFDLRLSRRIRFTERLGLEVIAEGFNMFNRANFQLPNGTFGTGATPNANFGRPTAAADPRRIQFGLRLSF